jgi:hypothetical protein
VSKEERFIIVQNGSPCSVRPVYVFHLFVSGLVCLDTVSSFCWVFDRPTDRPPSFPVVDAPREQAIGVRGTTTPASHLLAAGRGGPPAPWPRTGEGGEYHQHPPSFEGRLVDKGINWLHHWQVPVLEHYIATFKYCCSLGKRPTDRRLILILGGPAICARWYIEDKVSVPQNVLISKLEIESFRTHCLQ